MNRRTTCRVCGSAMLMELFSFGEQYISDFVRKEDICNGTKVPIELQRCEECTLVQAAYAPPPEKLYCKHYWYKSGTTETMREALRDVTASVEKLVKLEPGDIVLDIGSNDGTLLRPYTAENIVRVGCEPADNLATEENYKDLTLIHRMWSLVAYESEELPPAKVVTAIGMFYDLEDPSQFIADVAKVLAQDGLFVAQLMCLQNMLDTRDIGNFAHEHLEFYTLYSLNVLFQKHGLRIVGLETNEVNGKSYRLYVKHAGQPTLDSYQAYLTAWFREREHCSLDAVRRFYARAVSNKTKVVQFVQEKVAEGKSVWVYGASTKGNFILQWYGLDNSLIWGAADRSLEKCGLYTIGTGIPIASETDARILADYFLVLPYAFIDEFVRREATWLEEGGIFIVPLPEMRLISSVS